ncbi:MAG: hypothetical protein NT154_18820 [Verrucomicrobia bacterium]|nr:hypothetical protein [Verrucomicrobiota bacterium]
MAYKILNIGKANAEIHRLQADAARLGKPQPGWKKDSVAWLFKRIGPANAEIDRLETLVASLTPPIIPTLSGSPTPISTPNIAAPIAPQGGGAPGITLSRHQLLSALELFPAVEFDPTASDETLEHALRNASAEAGIRLPGDTAETPAALRQAAINRIVAAPEPAATIGAWNLESLTALVDAAFGPGTAMSVAGVVSFYQVSEGSKAAKLNQLPPGSHQWNQVFAEMKREAKSRLSAESSPQAQKKQLESLQRFLLGTGVRVPGLSYKGLQMPEGAAEALSPTKLAIAQKHVDEFCSVLSGDESAALSSHRAAAAARTFIAATNRRPFTIGMVPGPHVPEPTRLQGLYPGIPKSGI